MKLSRLRKGGQSYDSLISTMADQVLKLSDSEEEWDVEKIESDMNTIRKITTFTPLKALSRK